MSLESDRDMLEFPIPYMLGAMVSVFSFLLFAVGTTSFILGLLMLISEYTNLSDSLSSQELFWTLAGVSMITLSIFLRKFLVSAR